MVRLFLKFSAGIITLIVSLTALLALWLWPRDPYLPAVQAPFTVQRHADNPVVHQDLHRSLSAQDSPGGYVNINGPSLIRVPDWVDDPLGKYSCTLLTTRATVFVSPMVIHPTAPGPCMNPGYSAWLTRASR